MYYLGTVERALTSMLHIEQWSIPPLLVIVDVGYLQHGGSEVNRSHRLRYHVYSISSDAKLKDATVSACEDFRQAGVSTVLNWVAAEEVEKHRSIGQDAEKEHSGNNPEMGNYFIPSEMPNEYDCVRSLVLPAFLYCLLGNVIRMCVSKF